MSITRVYLGNPAGPFGMQALPAIRVGGSIGNGGLSPVFSRGTVAQATLSGGVTTQRLPQTKSGYSIDWFIRQPADINLLMSFYTGIQGSGPYCLVDPSQSNYLPPNVCAMGAVTGSLPEWAPTVGTLAADTTHAPPTGMLSGVAAWAGAGSGSILYAGLNNLIDGSWLPPVILGLSVRFSIWARTVSSTATIAAALMHGVGGSAPAGTATETASGGSLTTAWSQVSVVVASGFAWPTTSDFIMPKLTCSTGSAPNILLAGAEFVYDTGTTAAVLNPWVSGVGVPRVVIPDAAASPVGRPGLRDFSMSLAEAA